MKPMGVVLFVTSGMLSSQAHAAESEVPKPEIQEFARAGDVFLSSLFGVSADISDYRGAETNSWFKVTSQSYEQDLALSVYRGRASSIQISPVVDVMITPRISVGGRLLGGYSFSRDAVSAPYMNTTSTSEALQRTTLLGAALRVGYVRPIALGLVWWPRVEIEARSGYTKIESSTNPSQTTLPSQHSSDVRMNVRIASPIAARIARYLVAEVGPTLSISEPIGNELRSVRLLWGASLGLAL